MLVFCGSPSVVSRARLGLLLFVAGGGGKKKKNKHPVDVSGCLLMLS